MGLCPSKNSAASFKSKEDPMIFIQKTKLLQQEISVILKQREEEKDAYQREMMVSAFKEADWRKERKQLRDEIKRLRRKLEVKDERVREMEEEVESMATGKSDVLQGGVSVESGSTATSLLLVEQMREERARRDEAIEKWKMLYLAIKHELDDLIQRTHQGTLFCLAGGQDTREQIQKQLKAKDETIQLLNAQIAAMEDEGREKSREVDILKQSLRIICSKNGKTMTTPVAKTVL